MNKNNKTVALIGQPNTGKSTVFNFLTKSHQHVGNWPGKTVEQKTGKFYHGNEVYNVVDLPGAYSLTPNSEEERISRNYILNENPDIIVVLADAAQIERSLFLLSEIKLLPFPVVLILNMMDIAELQGKTINVAELEEKVGVPVVPMVAAKEKGFEQLIKTISSLSYQPDLLHFKEFQDLNDFEVVQKVLNKSETDPTLVNWYTVKLLEKDQQSIKEVKNTVSANQFGEINSVIQNTNNIAVAESKYNWIENIVKDTVSRKKKLHKIRQNKFDKIATHFVLGKILSVFAIFVPFLIGMCVVFPFMSLLKMPYRALLNLTALKCGSDVPFLLALFNEGFMPGLIAGVGMITFVVILRFIFTFFEDVGYMARLSYVYDTWMHRIGLHGKSMMPLIMSFGCNIGGITNSRTIDTWKQRMITIFIAPIVPCMGMWSVVVFMTGVFFGKSALPVVIILLAVMILHVSFSAFIGRKIYKAEKASGLIMELPPYHKPNWKNIFSQLWMQTKVYIKKILFIITAVALIIWVLSYQKDGNIENSILAHIGKFFDPITGIIGFDWKLFVAYCAACLSKESSLSIVAVLYGLGQGNSFTGVMLSDHSATTIPLFAEKLISTISPASALSFIFAFFFSIPCIGTVGALYSETKSLKVTILSCAYYTLASFVIAFVVYRIGLLLF